MIKNFLCIIINLLLFIGCSKAPDNQDATPEALPLWSIKLPNNNAKLIYGGGLIEPIIYNNDLIFHTTYNKSNGIEDNRLCAVDINTQKVDWMFPSNLNREFDYYFDGKGYRYNNLLVVKSPCQILSYKPDEDVICINLDTQEELWKNKYPGMHSGNTSVIGYQDKAYYVEIKGLEIFVIEANINTGETSNIVNFIANDANFIGESATMSLYSMGGNQYLLFGIHVDDKHTIYQYNINKGSIEKQFKIDLPGNYIIGDMIVDNDLLYVSCGGSVACINLLTWNIVWRYDNNDLRSPSMVIHKGVLFKNGTNDYMGIDIKTGKVLYSNSQLGTYWVVPHGDYIYMNTRKEQINIIDILTGKILDVIICPEDKLSGDGFNGAVNATFIDDKMAHAQ